MRLLPLAQGIYRWEPAAAGHEFNLQSTAWELIRNKLQTLRHLEEHEASPVRKVKTFPEAAPPRPGLFGRLLRFELCQALVCFLCGLPIGMAFQELLELGDGLRFVAFALINLRHEQIK